LFRPDFFAGLIALVSCITLSLIDMIERNRRMINRSHIELEN
jgi:hypothetical protein